MMIFTKEELKDFNLVLKKASLEYIPPCCNICHSIIHEYISGIRYEYGKTIYTCGTYCNHCGCYTPLGSICIADDTQERDSYEIPLETLCQAIHINENTLNNKPTPGYNEERDLLVKDKTLVLNSDEIKDFRKVIDKLPGNSFRMTLHGQCINCGHKGFELETSIKDNQLSLTMKCPSCNLSYPGTSINLKGVGTYEVSEKEIYNCLSHITKLIREKIREIKPKKIASLYKENQKLIENKDLYEIGLLVGIVTTHYGVDIGQSFVVEINTKLGLNLPTMFDVEVKYSEACTE